MNDRMSVVQMSDALAAFERIKRGEAKPDDLEFIHHIIKAFFAINAGAEIERCPDGILIRMTRSD